MLFILPMVKKGEPLSYAALPGKSDPPFECLNVFTKARGPGRHVDPNHESTETLLAIPGLSGSSLLT
jgi:hypothetical protein